MYLPLKTNRHAINANKLLKKLGIKTPDFEFQVMKQYVNYAGQKASDHIKETILENKPLMIARFGRTELICMHLYCNSKSGVSKYFKYAMGSIDSYKFTKKVSRNIYQVAGLFPITIETLSKFSELLLEDMKYLDILGSWVPQELHFKEELHNITKVNLEDLEPYYHNDPWSSSLTGKKVLIIHPYADSIKAQYKKRELLFNNPNVLPEFELKTIKAVQSNACNKTKYSNWFEALDYMKDLIDQTDFDMAIIGCGAYGFHLAAHIKRIGKQAIHMGGATQILFGIKGKRWESNQFISNLFNEHWVRPSKEETPKNIHVVEGGAYW